MTAFRLWAPRARTVALLLRGERHAMRSIGGSGGYFQLVIDASDGDRYAFSLDGANPLPDPRSAHQPDGVHGPSAVVDPARMRWTDAGWRGRDLRSAVLYELHVGTFTPEGTFEAIISRLDHLARLGVDAIELMPVAEFPGDRGWGYDGVDLYAPHHAYGGPQGLDRLVDACHARGIAVVLDLVHNHLGPDGNYLDRFGPYFTDRYRTPWGTAVNFDGPDSHWVREFVIENAITWLREHHLDGVRLDAVHAIIDNTAVHVVEELARRVQELEWHLDRDLWVIAESDLNDPKVVRPREQWGWGCDAQWSDDLHHALHAVLTGERHGYYADFGRLADLAKALRDVYVYDGRWSAFRRRLHGRPFGDLPGHRAVAYSQTHDQVGNRAAGERLSRLIGPGRLRIAAAVVLTSPFVPMLFMGEEWSAQTPFLYFTDHRDPKVARAVRDGRRYEFARSGLRPEDIVDPQSPGAFSQSKLDWSEAEREPHRSMLEWYRSLIALRRAVPELTDGRRDAALVAFDEDAAWMRITRGPITVAFSLKSDLDIPLGPRPGDTRESDTSRPGELILASDPAIALRDGDIHLTRDSVAIVRMR